jgi:hypothetical protein
MARPTGLPEMLAPVALDLGIGDDVGLAVELGAEAPRLHLMAKGGRRQPESGGGFGKGQHASVFGREQVLRRVVGDPRRLEVGVRGAQASGRLDPITEGYARDQGIQSGLGHPHRRLGRLEPLRCVEQRLEVRHLGVPSVPVHGQNIAAIGHVVKASQPYARAVLDG